MKMTGLIVIAVVLGAAVVQDVTGRVHYGLTFCVNDKSCNGHGTCNSTCSSTASFTGPSIGKGCICTDNYTGDFCQVAPDCTPNGGECGAHGQCTKSLTCNCTDFYLGSFCQIAPVCTPNGNECGSYGECNTCSSQRTCLCHSGYAGTHCNIAPVCTPGGNECQNGGECNFRISPYNCTCLPDFENLSATCGTHHVVIAMSTLVLPLLGRFMMME